jgi:two-component system response regulator AtoC
LSRRTVLVVDDEVKMQRILELTLADLGHHVLRAGGGREALAIIDAESVDLVITDLRMPDVDGLTLLKTLHEQGRALPTIVITAHGTVETAVEAMKYGAIDYILRPFEVETVELAVTRALGVSRVERENRYLRGEIEQGWDEFVGASAPMQRLYHLIQQASPTGAACLVVGETGTGKELVARAVHRASGRTGLFVPINCAAIPASILESELFGHTRGAFTGAHAERIGKFELAEAAARAAGTLARASREQSPDRNRSACRRRDESRSADRGRGGPPAQGPLLPPRRGAARSAAAAQSP